MSIALLYAAASKRRSVTGASGHVEEVGCTSDED